MNLREIKIALTVDLMNLPESPTTVFSVQDAMSRFQNETGSFKGVTESSVTKFGDGMEGKSVALHFENLRLDLNLITNAQTSEQLIKGFELKETFA